MHAFRRGFKPSTTRLLTGLLLLALLAVHGHAGVVRHLLGTAHRHDGGHPVATLSMAAAAALRAQIDEGLDRLHIWRHEHAAHHPAEGPAAAAHRHGDVKRHHHDIGDASVLALDDGGAAGQRGAEGPGAAPASGAEAPPGLAGAPRLAARDMALAACAWPCAPTRTWQNALVRLPERPPRA